MLHRVAVLLFFPDHRLSNSVSIRVDAPGVALIVLLHRIPMVRRETPHLAYGAGGACPTAPFRVFARTLGRCLRPPESCTAFACIERSVARHARSERQLFLSLCLLNSLHAPLATHVSLRSIEPDGDGVRTGPVRADGRAPARGRPACAGKPWTVDSGESALHHVIGRALGSGDGVSAASYDRGLQKTKIAPPMIA